MSVLAFFTAALIQAAPLSQPQNEPRESAFDRLFDGVAEPTDSGADERAGRDELLLAQLRSGKWILADALEVYPAPDSGWCTPPTPLFEAMEVDFSDDGTSLRVTLYEPLRRHSIDADSLYSSPSGPCLDLDIVSRILEVQFAVDPVGLNVNIEGGGTLPSVARREQSESRARRMGRTEPTAPSYPRLEAPASWLAFPTIDVNAAVRISSGAPQTTIEIQGGGDFATATAHWRGTVDQDGIARIGARLEKVDPAGGLLGIGARRIEVGDIFANPQPLLGASVGGRGIRVSSEPEWRADLFDVIVIEGPLREGWRAELLNENRLIAFVDTPDRRGFYRFEDVPLVAGLNRYVVELYGPYGEREQRVVRRVVGPEQHPENEITFTAGLVAPTERSQIAGGSNKPILFFQSSIGLSERMSMDISARSEIGDRPNHGVSAALAASILGGTGSVVAAYRSPESTAATLAFARNIGNWAVRLETADYGPQEPVWRSSDGLGYRRMISIDTSGPLVLGGRTISLDWSLTHLERRDGNSETRLSQSLAIRTGRLRIDHRIGIESSGDRLLAIGEMAASRRWQGWEGRAYANYALASDPGLRSIGVSVARSNSNRAWRMQLRRDFEGGFTAASVGASLRLRPIDLSVDAGWGSAGLSVQANVRLAFGKIPGGGLILLPAGSSQLGTLLPQLKHRDRRPQPGGRYIVDSTLRTEVGDEEGTTLLTGIAPYRNTSLSLQQLSLEDDRDRPDRDGVEIIARPGQLLPVSFILSPTGEVEVQVLRQAGELRRPLSGVAVRLMSSEGSAHEAITDWDGYAFFDGVSLGDFQLTATSDQLTATRDATLNLSTREISLKLVL